MNVAMLSSLKHADFQTLEINDFVTLILRHPVPGPQRQGLIWAAQRAPAHSLIFGLLPLAPYFSSFPTSLHLHQPDYGDRFSSTNHQQLPILSHLTTHTRLQT